VTKLRAENRIVYVDFTARWCVTCQANKAALASSKELQAEFARRKVAKLKGDWTNRDPEITSLLKDLGRAGVPLYLLWVPGAAQPKILPQVLTESLILSELAAIPAAKR
jgi:thiol:disulfide interchange protein DsbD